MCVCVKIDNIIITALCVCVLTLVYCTVFFAIFKCTSTIIKTPVPVGIILQLSATYMYKYYHHEDIISCCIIIVVLKHVFGNVLKEAMLDSTTSAVVLIIYCTTI